MTTQTETIAKKTRPLLEQAVVLPCDVTCDIQTENVLTETIRKYGKLDFVIHAVAGAPKGSLESFMGCSRDHFLQAMNVSVFSLVNIVHLALPHLTKTQGSVVTFSFVGSRKVISEYGLMGPAKAALESSVKYLAVECGSYGVRINAISPGPISTVSARAVPNFLTLKEKFEREVPLKSSVSLNEDVSSAA